MAGQSGCNIAQTILGNLYDLCAISIKFTTKPTIPYNPEQDVGIEGKANNQPGTTSQGLLVGGNMHNRYHPNLYQKASALTRMVRQETRP